MSNNGDSSTADSARGKRQRYSKACDECCRKKVRCNSDTMPNNICSECIITKVPCTRTKERKKRGPKLGSTREPPVDQTATVKTLTKKILSGVHTVSDDMDSARGALFQMATYIQYLERKLTAREKYPRAQSQSRVEPISLSTSPPTAHTEDTTSDARTLCREFAQLTASVSLSQSHFGESSNPMLLMSAIDIGREVRFDERSVLPEWQTVFETQVKRPQFWSSPWISYPRDSGPYRFPDPDLLSRLVNLYFDRHAVIFPLLHRSTFERDLAQGLHFWNKDFAGLVLALSALGSRYLEDPPTHDPDSVYDLGWQWFKQIQRSPHWDYVKPAPLHQVQMLCLTCFYLRTTATPDAAWVFTGVTMRMIIERGAHRHISGQRLTVEGELWKRAFWILDIFDAHLSAYTGRPMALRFEDHDSEYPVECDEEYWENIDEAKAFVQPEGKPCRTSVFNHYIKLNEILASVLRLLYPVQKPKFASKAEALDWYQNTVTELDVALTKWADSIPEHLKWDSKKDDLFFRQSTFLYITFYWVQIHIHRQFIPRPGRKPLLNFSSLAICTNAARTCSRMVYTCTFRYSALAGEDPTAVFDCALILLVHLWRGIKMGVTLNIETEMIDVRKCISIFAAWEKRSRQAGRMHDLVNALIAISGLSSTNPTLSIPTSTNDHLPGTDPISTSSYSQVEDPLHDFWNTLPVHSHELGELPIYETSTANFTDQLGEDLFSAPGPESGLSSGGTQNVNDPLSTTVSDYSQPSQVDPANRNYMTEDEWINFMTDIDPMFSAFCPS
ncbi:hypothetical protein K435DRAFT_841716 [Dendrothele bispora CBS 962.96]|uniref:Zn(2)-C6 fungal-type domain-containing protein n=1 Tax=Dendrothele bispora (strain CBS 962.96) TaxID=1314807 RepID=A0A4V4HE35_DENBC|nr:hypothetical protein K435DRAFT_841716 [Dendrothele bispora CBS 962.96]